MAQGIPQPVPFSLRPLVPWLCGTSERAWIAMTFISAATAAAATGVLAHQHGAGLGGALFASCLLLGLPWLRFCVSAPILVDMPMLAFALGAAVLAPVHLPFALLLAWVGAAASEKVPVLAALFAWNPLLLTALCVPLILWAVMPKAKPDRELYSGLRVGLAAHRGRWREPRLMLLPWGACLVALVPAVWVAVALAVGYGQLLVATDSVRLYQSVAPVICVVAALSVPPEWYAPVLLAHWFNPWAGDGV